jgi:tetratricopeptide (TPR) repeat protein
MHTKAIAIIIALIAATYVNSLPNGFVRDDPLFFEHNTFYKSWSNFPTLLKTDYIVTGNRMALNPPGDLGSGEVSYRPVGSATFFIDGWLWPENAFGYHLVNFLLHAANGVLTYMLLLAVTGTSAAALLGALLFGVHPINSEAVCNIGFRADLLAFFFAVSAFLLFLKHDRYAGPRRGIYYLAALVCFFFAVFSKESAVFLPVMLLAYDFYWRKIQFVRHAPFIGVTLFFLFVYFFVFPNSTLAALEPDLAGRIPGMLAILAAYLKAFVLPTSVHVLPTLYAPPAQTVMSGEVVLALAAVIALVWGIVAFYKNHKGLSFLLLWFLAAYLPVSNLVPIANPMAHRFMYLPSLGILGAAALALCRIEQAYRHSKKLPTFGKILKYGILALCMLTTISLNGLWRSDALLAMDITRQYPQNASGHFALGLAYFKEGLYDEAVVAFQRAEQLGLDDPRLFYYLGLSYRKDFNKMRKYLTMAMTADYALPYLALGHEHLIRGAPEQALPYLEKGVVLAPAEFAPAYEDLMAAYLQLGRIEDARELLRRAREAVKDQETLRHLTDLFEKGSMTGG